MPISTRVSWALGLTLAGVAVVAAQSNGQGTADKATRQASGTQGATTKGLAPAVFGSIDMDKVFKEYRRVSDLNDQINADAVRKQAELGSMANEYSELAKQLEGLNPGTEDFTSREKRLMELKAKLEAAREQAQNEFARREAEALAEIYKEIAAMTAAVAKYKGMTYVLRISDEPPAGSDPRSVMAAMSRSVVYSDPSTDISEMVVLNLNRNYDKTHPPAAKPAQAAPAGNAAPAAH